VALDILTFGEALVEVMRTGIDQPLHLTGMFEGPYPSGAPFIFTVQAARLGARAACIGCVGDDAFAENLLEQLRRDGVETDTVKTLPGYSTGVAFIAYNGDGSRNYVFHMRHAAAGQISPKLLEKRWFDGLKLLHLSGSALAMHADALALGKKALQYAQAAGAKVSFDINFRPQLIKLENAQAAFAPFIEAADVILATGDEAQQVTSAHTIDEAIGALMGASLSRVVVLHQGKDGCVVYTSRGSEPIASFAVDEIDPTGAGDCFDAGFLVRWLEGAAPSDAARFANACGALAVTAKGPMTGAKSRAEVEIFLRERLAT
jgi:tagatose kinase